MKSTFDFHVKGSYASLVLALLVLPLVAASLYWWLGSSRRVEVVMAIIAAGIALTALIYSAINVHQILDTNEETLANNRLKFASELIASYNEPEMPQLTVIAAALSKTLIKLQPGEVNTYLQENKDAEMDIIYILNFFEGMAQAVDRKLADEAFLRDYFQLIVRVNYHALKMYIESQQKEYQSEIPGKKFKWLAERWEG
jgi:hypothetical protein